MSEKINELLAWLGKDEYQMSRTRLICPGCGFIEIYCDCSPDKDPGENTEGHRYQSEKNALKDAYLNEKDSHQGDNRR